MIEVYSWATRTATRSTSCSRSAAFADLKDGFDRVSERPAVQRGVEFLAGLHKPIHDDRSREILFGSKQYEKR